MVECQLPKLDAVGSNPISRSIFSITCKEFPIRDSIVFEVTRYLEIRNSLLIRDLNNRLEAARAGIRSEDVGGSSQSNLGRPVMKMACNEVMLYARYVI